MFKFCLAFLMVLHRADAASSLARNKTAHGNSYNVNYDARYAVDGIYRQSATLHNYFLSNDFYTGTNWWSVELGALYYIDRVVVFITKGYEQYLDNFIVGLSNARKVPVVRNTYDVCEQYHEIVTPVSSYKVKCNANLSKYSVVIIQGSVAGYSILALSEVEVFEPKNHESKLWMRFPDQRWKKTTTYNKTSSRAACVSECSARNCYLVNYKNATQLCELFQTLKGMGEPYTLTTAIGWETWKVQYA